MAAKKDSKIVKRHQKELRLICVVCKQTFVARTLAAKTCGPACRQRKSRYGNHAHKAETYSGQINKAMEGFVYVIGAQNGLVKLGLTKNLKRRFTALQLSSPVRLEILDSVFSTNCYVL